MQIHYFQRYHSKENVVTSNTLLMLSRLYNYNSDKFFSMLNTLVLGADSSPELTFELQVPGDGSVPDAVIGQPSFKVIVETKLYNQFGKEQLLRHLSNFSSEDIKVLLTIDPRPMNSQLLSELQAEIEEYNRSNLARLISPIKHVNITFEQLVQSMEDIVDDRDTEIVAVLDDFKKYCLDEKLIPDGYKWMRAVTVGTTIQDNLELDLYYDKDTVNSSDHGYVGLYNKKRICAIGKLTKTVIAYEENGEVKFLPEGGATVTDDEKERIREAIRRADSYGYDLLSNRHRFFLVDRFYPTDFRKNSKNPIQKSKFFNLAEMLGYSTMPDTQKIAADLSGRTWEEL